MEKNGNLENITIQNTDRQYLTLRNSHLLVSLGVTLLAALIYGVSPVSVVPLVFDIDVGTVDLGNVFRVLMCLYLAVSCIWVLGILKQGYWQIATITNIVFMASLSSDRIISWVFDGTRSTNLIFSLIGELFLGVFGLVQYRKYNSTF